MKICKDCGLEKPIELFAKDSSCKGGYRNRCKACHALKQQSLRKERPEHYKKYQKQYQEKVRQGLIQPRTFNPDGSYDHKRNYVNQIKKNSGCIRCGEREPVCLDFHHLDPSQKDFGIGAFTNKTLNQIDEEVKKCVVICANCHRKLHAGLISV